MSSISPAVAPRGPHSRNTRKPSAYIRLIVCSRRTGATHCSAAASRALRAFGGSGSVVPQLYTGMCGRSSTQFPANLRNCERIFPHQGVLNGRSTARRIPRTPAAASACCTSSTASGAIASVRWRGEQCSATATFSGGKLATISSVWPGCGETVDTITHRGSPAWSTAVFTSLYMSRRNARRSFRSNFPNSPPAASALKSPPAKPVTPSGWIPNDVSIR